MNTTTIDFSSLFIHSPIPHWVYDLETHRILEVNNAALNQYGYTREEFLELNMKDLGLKEELENFLRAHQQEEGESGNINFGVFTHQKKHGERVHVEIHGHRIGCQEKNAMMVTVVDVTRQMKILEDVSESEEKLKEASKIARLGYWKLDLIHNSLTWSDEVYTIWGVDCQTFTPNYDSFFNSIPEDERSKFKAYQEEIIRNAGELNYTHRILLPDGGIKWVIERGRLEVKDGKPVSLFGTVQDITEQKKEEIRLRLLESVITNTHDAVIITEAEAIDISGPRIIYVNEAFTKMTGYTAEEAIGKSPAFLHGPKTDLKELAKLGEAIRNWQSCELTLLNYKKNGEPFWMNFTAIPVADESGWYTHWIAIERDVTEQKNELIKNELFNKISTAFNPDTSLKKSLTEVCHTISDFVESCYTEIWLPDPQHNTLSLFVKCMRNEQAEIFYKQAQAFETFNNDEGLPGKVWTTKSAVLLENKNATPDFKRSVIALNSGIKTVLGIPLKHNDTVIGVLSCGSKESSQALENSRPVLEKLESYIGSEIYRKKLETELVQFFDAIPDLICLVDLQGNFIKVNQSGCKMLGYSEQELIGTSYMNYVFEADKNITHDEHEQLVHGNYSLEFKNRYVTKSGEIIWLNWHSNVNVEEGIIYATAKNITHEKKLDELLKDASRLSRIGSWEIDYVNHKIYWSDMVHELHETNPKTYTPEWESGISFYRSDYREDILKHVETIITTGKPFDFEAPIISAKGNERWIRSIGKAEFSEGKCIRLFGSFQDIHAIKTTELQLSEILGSISDAFYAVDKNWNFTYFNKEAENLLHRKSEEIIGRNLWEEFVPAVGTEIEKIYRDVAKTGKPQSFEYFYPGDGSWYEINAYPSNGGVSSYFKNIDERRKNAEAIRKAFEEKNNILESIGDAFFALDTDGMVTYWNKQAEEVMLKPRNEIIGKHLWTEYKDVMDTDFYRMYLLAKQNGQTVTFEEFNPFLKKWFETTAYPNDEGMSVYFKDITLRKESERKINEANERFEKVALATSDAIWDWDIENNSFYRGDGYNELFGTNINNHVLESDIWLDDSTNIPAEQLKQMVMDILKDPSKDNWVLEYSIKAPDGDVRSVIDKGIIIRDTYGKAIRLVGAITDITYRKNFERQLLQLNKELQKQVKALKIANEELEQFAFITSHDLQEPLRMITSFMDQLQRKYSHQLDDKANQYIYFATDGAKRMKKIILDLLEYSRAGKSNHHEERVNLTEILNNFCYLRKKIIEEKGVTIHYENLPEVLASKTPLTQVLHNLLDNAIKYTRSEVAPVIQLTVTDQNDKWLFEIKDNGIGIDQEFYDKIFVIFQRLHNRDQYDGTGIGLALVKKQVESWGEKIGVQSILNQGSTFYFTLKK